MTNAAHLSHASDPWTSRAAAREHVESGANASQCAAIYALVLRAPGHTSRELAEESEFDRYTLARRLSDLEHEGRVEKGPARKCRIGGRSAVTWNAVRPAPEQGVMSL